MDEKENRVEDPKNGKPPNPPAAPVVPKLELTQDHWSIFDKIVCINLEDRTDRKISVQKMFSKYNIPCEFYTAKKHPRGPEYGCFHSHVTVMAQALQDPNVNNMLIFEDDADMLNHPTIAQYNEVKKFMQSFTNWDLFFLGAYPNIFFERASQVAGYHNILKLQSQLTHAYVVSRDFMTLMVKADYDLLRVPIDRIYLNNSRSYAVLPTWFYQTDSPSDISKQPRWTPFLRRTAVNFKSKFASTSGLPGYILVVLGVCLLLVIILYLARS